MPQANRPVRTSSLSACSTGVLTTNGRERSIVTTNSRFPLFVLRDYAVAADGERGMLVGPRGDIAWLCAPRWESDAIFSNLIGGGGTYAVTPVAESFVWGGVYEPGSLIWRNRWTTPDQQIECRDALAYPGRARTAIILRKVTSQARAAVRIVLDPRACFGEHGLRDVTKRNGVWIARCGDLYLRWTGAAEARRQADGSLAFTLTVEAGTPRDLVLEISEEPLEGELDADELWRTTEMAWDAVVPAVSGTLADDDVRHSLAILHGLTTHGGGMVAGATTSLPERFGGAKNYDYRYAWIRDQCYVGQAAALVGDLRLLDDAVAFVSSRILADGADLKPAYTTDGGPVPDERHLDLPGYPGGADKVGNWVNQQFQLDSLGEALLLFAAAARQERLDETGSAAVAAAVDVIRERYRTPDAGIWELEDELWTHSRLSCVAGLRKIASISTSSDASGWSVLADEILADIGTTSLHPTGRWKRAVSDDRVDSALLIPAVRGALPPSDPRTIATLESALAELGDSGYMYRFRMDGDAPSQEEGAFLLSGFMTSLALHQQGRHVEAARWFERNRAARGTPGVFSEEYDVGQRQMRGNLPQAFVHALFIEAAATLAGKEASPVAG
ncbi:MAG: glycoside hydrolase family 15 protein [Acidobacteria bacterium]|nr:glycoside hydrolase family 15 protein [Acidobacteriota bacterium]